MKRHRTLLMKLQKDHKGNLSAFIPLLSYNACTSNILKEPNLAVGFLYYAAHLL